MSEFFYVPLTAWSYRGVDLGITPKVGSTIKVYERKEGQLSVSAEMINSLMNKSAPEKCEGSTRQK